VAAGDFIVGALTLAAIWGSALVTAAVVVRRRYRGSPAHVAATAGILVALTTVLLATVAPAAVGVLSRASASLIAVVVGVLAVAVVPARAGGGVEAAGAGPPPGALAGGGSHWPGRAAIALALVTATGTLALFLGRATEAFRSIDSVTFHLPNVARWLQTGSLWQIDQFIPFQAQGNYPHSGDFLLLSVVLPWSDDWAVRPFALALYAAMAVTVWALARELGAPGSAAVAAASASAAVPIALGAVVGGGYPDVVTYAGLAAAVTFGVRHHRTGARQDLVLAGVALGLAAGTKWYGLPMAAVVLVVGAAAAAIAGRRRPVALRDAALATGIAALTGGIWLVRNLALSGSPLFPQKVAIGGLTVFDAPPDPVRERVGFSVAHYLGDPDALRNFVLPGWRLGLGTVALLVAGGGVVLALTARRRPWRGHARLAAVLALLLGLVYLVTPYTALGFEGQPVGAYFNTRYAVPALIFALSAAALAARRSARAEALAVAALGLATLDGLRRLGAYRGLDGYRPATVLAAVALVGAAGLAALAWRRVRHRGDRGRWPVVAVAGAVLLVAGVAGRRLEQRYDDRRYRGIDPTIDWVRAHAPSGRNVGLTGDWDDNTAFPTLPYFGPRLGNRVAQIAPFERGLLTRYRSRGAFLRAVRRGRYDLVVVRDSPLRRRPPPALAWLRADAYEPVAGGGEATLLRAPRHR
jgi:hypothetical protein